MATESFNCFSGLLSAAFIAKPTRALLDPPLSSAPFPALLPLLPHGEDGAVSSPHPGRCSPTKANDSEISTAVSQSLAQETSNYESSVTLVNKYNYISNRKNNDRCLRWQLRQLPDLTFYAGTEIPHSRP